MCGKQFKSQKSSLNTTGMSILKEIFLAPCVTQPPPPAWKPPPWFPRQSPSHLKLWLSGHRICMVSLWCIPEYNPTDCKINLIAQLCLRDFNKKCMIQAAMNRNIKLSLPLLFLDVLLDHLGSQLLAHLHDYEAQLPSWPFLPPPSTWCASWPPRQAPPPSFPWCPPWPVKLTV